MALLSSPPAASPRRFSGRGMRLVHWIGGQLYRFAFSIMALVIQVQYTRRPKQHVEDVIIPALSSNVPDPPACFKLLNYVLRRN